MMTPKDQESDYLELFLSSAYGDASSTVANEPEEPTPTDIDRYHIVETVGRGGIGMVYRVEDPKLGRELAIKVLRQKHAADGELRRKFVEEARICSRLQHPGVISVHDVGTTEDGRPYFTRKLVDGQTLADRPNLRSPAERDARRDLELFERLCQTIAYVHRHDVVHGDLKPHNVMVGAFGELQVMDWGFARDRRERRHDDPSPPSRARVIGTPAYMAPEQARGGGQVDSRTDVFGLGAVLCEMLTGTPPHLGETKEDVCSQAAKGELADAYFRLRASGADPAMVELAVECLAPRPDDRPSDASEVARRVSDHLADLTRRARALELEAAEARARAEQERRARRLALALMISIALGIAVTAAGFVWYEREAGRRQATVERQVSAAVERASLLREQALAAGLGGGESRWTEAQTAAREALAFSGSPDVAQSTRTRTEQLAANIEREAQIAARDARITLSLAELRPHLGDDRPTAEVDRSYRELFAECGVDVDGDLDRAAAALRESTLLGPMIEAIDEWVHHRRRLADAAQSWRRLVDLANRVDDDPWRRGLRGAYVDGDAERLERLASEPEARRSPVRLDLVARCLLELDHLDQALALYREAAELHPGDYGIHHNLASKLNLVHPRPSEEILRHLQIAVAVRPNSAHARTDLALEYLVQQRVDEAERCARAACDIDPRYARALFILASTLERQQRTPEAIEYARRAWDLGLTGAGVLLVQALVLNGEAAEAMELAREGVARAPRSSAWHYTLAALLVDAYQYEEALAETAEALRLGPDNADLYGVRAIALVNTGRLTEAAECIDEGIRFGTEIGRPMRDSYARWAGIARASIEACKTLDEIRAGSPLPATPAAREDLAEIALCTGDVALAVRLIDSVVTEASPAPLSPWTHFLAARTHARMAIEGEGDPNEHAQATLTAYIATVEGLERQLSAGPIEPRTALLNVRRLLAEPNIRAVADRDPDAWRGAEQRVDAVQKALRRR